jgi:GT2 family glycosyltransferase
MQPFNKFKVLIAVYLSRFPRLFAIAKSVYLLRVQYREQHFQLTSSRNLSKNDGEWKIARQKFFSKYLPKKVKSQIISESSDFEIPEKVSLSIDICIPIYNRFDLAETLLRQIKGQSDSLVEKYSWKVNVIVADDHSSPRTKTALKDLCADLNFTLIVQDSNLGVVGNVNSAFNKTCGDVFLLFNSDAQIIDNTILAMLKPFLQNSKVGLVTAPNFDIFDKFMETPSNWRSIGDFLISTSNDDINYVDACTAISYAIGIRRCAVTSQFLMDPAFGMGYGEDSDLHYQLVTRGWSSVWTLDTLVSHFGGASFGQDEKASGHRAHGRQLFFERWGKKYFSEIEAHEEVLAVAVKNRLRGFKETTFERILVITPSDKRNIGGLTVANQLVRSKLVAGSKVELLILDEYYPRNYDDVLRTSKSPVKWASFNEVVFVGVGSIRWFRQQNVNGAEFSLSFFLQGPDWVIDPEGVNELVFLENSISKFIVTSSVTQKMALQINPRAEIEFISPNLRDAAFSGFETQSKNFDFIFSLREEYGKGSHLAESMIRYLSRNHRILVVSDLNLGDLGTNVRIAKRSEPREFYKNLASAKVYVDTSLYEGFGMVPRQAISLNVKCAFFGFIGSPADLLEYPAHCVQLSDPYDLIGNILILEDLLLSENCQGCGYCGIF